MQTTEQKFWENVDKRGPNECWMWIGRTVPSNEGKSEYGQCWDGERTVYAHRFAYELLVGQIPEGLTLDHVKDRGCTSTLCVNPAHLEPVTRKVNILRGTGIGALNARKTTCLRGHPFDEENTFIYSFGPRAGARHCRICGRDRKRSQRLQLANSLL